MSSTDHTNSSESLSDVDLGEHIYRLSLPLPSALNNLPKIRHSRSSYGSCLSIHYEESEVPPLKLPTTARSSSRLDKELPPPPPITPPRKRPRLPQFDTTLSPRVMMASPTPVSKGKRRSIQPDIPTEGLTDATVPEPVDSREDEWSPRMHGVTEMSAIEPIGSTEEGPSMIGPRGSSKKIRQSRFSESRMTPIRKHRFSGLTHLDPDDLEPSAAPPPSVSPYSPRRSRIDDVVKPLSRSVSQLEVMEKGEISDPYSQLYIISYLIFFSILGTLARIGIKQLTFFEGAPANIPVLWANFSGTLILGFLLEDRNLFMEAAASPASSPPHDLAKVRTDHMNIKKTVPLYIGLATGFCGSFTSFSSFMLDAFLSISNNLPTPINHPYPPGYTLPATSTTVHRPAGYAVAALLATIILHLAVSLSALKVGAHIALSLDGWMPSIPLRFLRRILDRLIVPLGFLSWFATVILTIFPPDRPGGNQGRESWSDETWRGTALIALTLAPVGCILRYMLALQLNSFAAYFPLGTFAANIFGTAVLAMAYVLQHANLIQSVSDGTVQSIGGGLIGCQILQGVMDGFCGACTTVSTWCAEMVTLNRRGYLYGAVTTVAGLSFMVIICGSARWTVGFDGGVC